MYVESVQVAHVENELIEFRKQANYWKAQHARAVEREVLWKEKASQLEEVVGRQAAIIVEQSQRIEVLEARLAWLQKQLFGRKTEELGTKTRETSEVPEVSQSADDDPASVDCLESSSDESRKRGKQRGTKGYGRKLRLTLPCEEIPHDLTAAEKHCQKCGKAFSVFPGTEDSEEIDWRVTLVRIVHKRIRYKPTCDCEAGPGIVSAPVPAKLIPKGMFTTGFWVRLLLEKYLFARPLYRAKQVLELEGLNVSQGTLTGGLARIKELVQPLYAGILERSRKAKHWQWDETRWMVFVDILGKVGHRWWLWVVVTKDTCAYLLEPSRSADVPRRHLGEEAEGIINADRYSVYKALGEKILIAFCWSHIRRDFIQIRDGYKKLRAWAQSWVVDINELFALNAKRFAVLGCSDEFKKADQALRTAVAAMAERLARELRDTTLHLVQRKALESLRNHWEGATIFVDHPQIPMDNNESERRLRNPVIGRKNYYGSGSLWSGMLTASMFTIFQTLLKNNIDPQKHLTAYFEACAKNGGRAPDDIEAFLPWNLTEKQKIDWRNTREPP